jgi:hypothetical protein
MNILFFSSCRKDTSNQLESMIKSIYFQANEVFIFHEYKMHCISEIMKVPERKGLNKHRAHYRISFIEYGNHMSMQTFHSQHPYKLHKEGPTNQLVSESRCKDATGIAPRVIISYSAINQCTEATYQHHIFRFTQLFSYCRA